MMKALRFATAPMFKCTGTREPTLQHSPYSFLFISSNMFWHIFSWIIVRIYSGRFVMSVGWGRRIDVYLVSIKAQGSPAFPFHISIIPQMALIKRLTAVTCFPPPLSCLSLSAFPFFIYWISCTFTLHVLFILLCMRMHYSKYTPQIRNWIKKKPTLRAYEGNIEEYVNHICPEVDFVQKILNDFQVIRI